MVRIERLDRGQIARFGIPDGQRGNRGMGWQGKDGIKSHGTSVASAIQ